MIARILLVSYLILSSYPSWANRYDYTVIIDPTHSTTDILVRYADPNNPCWVYLYLIKDPSHPSNNSQTPTVEAPLPNQNFSTLFVPVEAIRKMDRRQLAVNAIRSFDQLISRVTYASSKDPRLQSLVTQSPKPSSLSLLEVLLYRDPALMITLSNVELVSLGVDLEMTRQLRDLGILPTGVVTPTLDDLSRRLVSHSPRLKDLSSPSLHIIEHALRLIQEATADSAERMQTSWSAQKQELIQLL